MTVLTFTNGPLMVNTYVVADSKNQAAIIDPGHGMSNLFETIKELQITPKAIMLTHAHLDHIAGVPQILKKFPDLNIYMNKEDIPLLDRTGMQSEVIGLPNIEDFTVDKLLDDTGEINIGDLNFTYLYTPGHSKGSLSYKIDNMIFTGDVLFKTSIGRSDLFGGNFSELIYSIKEKLFNLPEDMTVYPGHGETTTIGYEKQHNPFLK